jgi:peptidoglycan biosynthesis protein MviN/MurJ (putative lipid II flippase)
MLTALVLLERYSFYSLMIADSVKHVVHTSISGWLLWRRIGGLRGQRLPVTLGRALLAAAAMAACTYLTLAGLETALAAASPVGELMLVTLPGLVGVVVFVAVGYLEGLDELRWLMGFANQRLGKFGRFGG